jgi:hypothetical protein
MRRGLRLLAVALVVATAAGVAASASGRHQARKQSSGQSALRSVVYRAAADYLGMTRRELRRTRRSGQSLLQIAEARGKSVVAFKAVLNGATRDWVVRRGVAGELTRARSRQILGTARGEVDAMVRQRPAAGFRGGPDLGKVLTTAAASYLGLTQDELAGRLQAGRTFERLAAARKLSAAGLRLAMWNAVRSKLDRRVAIGALDGDKRAKLLARAERRIERLVAPSEPAPGPS